ncbi:MAG: hypothetical protein CVV47_02715 [Spirochaetae bacterium HGW-Spirochaetae-3]|jgi:hypothetical protein|nr:MAG: hypothetical protein CVV47_02715 [Spirochaetae bacterium HGW-Spirochaetae-3]
MAGAMVRGDMKLLVDEFGLEAAFRFTPSNDGPEWNADGLARLLAEARVAGVQGRRLEEALQNFAKAREPAIEVVARGQSPELGTPEDAEWSDLRTPPEFLAFEDKTIAEAAPPELFRVRSERIARERIVKKPGALPFLPAREEKIVEYEKTESREPVAVDTRVIRLFWTPKGAVVARLSPSRPGKSGKNVYGKPVPPPQADDAAFHLGKGLTRVKGEVVSDEAGFVRVGARWADLVPFRAGEYSIRMSDDHATVLLDYSPGDKRLPPPEAAPILAEAVALGQAAENLIPEEEAASALLKSTRSGQPLTGYSLSCDRDGYARVDISPDRLKATLNVVKGRGRGKPLTLPMVSESLAGHKIKGVKVDKLKVDVVTFYKGKETELSDYPLAEGKEPVKGKDRSLVYSVAFMPELQAKDYIAAAEKAPALSRVAGRFDEFPLKSASRIALVKKGQEIARFSAPSSGQAGTDVFGATIPAGQGNDPVVKLFENLRISQESIQSQDDGLLLIDEREDGTMARVLPFRDARVSVDVAEDAMSARVDIERGYGLGRELTLELAQESLAQAGVTYGVDLKEISAALTRAREGEPVSGCLVAKGAEPVPAGGYRLNWIVRIASGAAVTVRSDGSADYKNQDRATIVVEGQPLLEMLAIGVEGQNGQDVLGSVIPAPKDPRVADPPGFDETIVEERKENGDRLLKAGKNGELKFEKNALSIDAAQRIKGDVGPATGNVKFPGPVAIAGTILTGYAVVAGGDVLVTGAVEAALVSADGAIKITEGIKGAKRGTIRARKTIEASFAEQAMLLAVDDIVLKNSALLCNIKTNGRLRLLGEKGHLIGGLCRTRKGVEVQNLGSANGAKTQVSFGQDYLVKDSIEAEEREIERVKAMILQADKTMREQEAAGVNLEKIRGDKLRLVKLLEQRSLRVFELREKFEEHFPSELVIRGSVFAGVVIESHNRFHEVRQTKQKVAFSFDQQLGRVVERPLK